MATSRDSRPFILIIILLLLINSPEPQQQSFATRPRYDHTIAREWDALDVLNRTRYGDFDGEHGHWLNLTGFRENDGLAWQLLAPVQQRAKEQTVGLLGVQAEGALTGSLDESSYSAVYRNVTGFVQGEWARSKIGHDSPAPLLNLSAIAPDSAYPLADYDRNLTGGSGNVRIHFTELGDRTRANVNESISEISARIVIGEDTSMGDWWEFTLHGVHFLKFGGVVLTTTSEKFAGIFALPHFTITDHLYSISQELLNRTVHDTITRQESRSYPTWNPWSSAVDGTSESLFPAPHCEYIIYLQQHPVHINRPSKQYPISNPYFMGLIEDEMRYPTGSPLPNPSQLSMSMVAFSPDCGFVIESKGPPEYSPTEASHLKGLKLEKFMDGARRSTLAFAAVLALQVILVVRQMKEASTPSTRSRISFYSIAVLALGDGFAFLTLIFVHLYLNTSLLALYATAFLALFSVVFELRFLMDIWTVQATERRRQERQEASIHPAATSPGVSLSNVPQGTQPTGPIDSAAGVDTLPLPVTASRRGVDTGVTSIILPPDQDEDATADANTATGTTGSTGPVSTRIELGTLYTRYCLILIVTFFLTLHSTSWPTAARSIYSNLLAFSYLSFWCPQIYRNIMRNCRKALRWDFVIGQSLVRLMPITYFYAVSDNIIFSENDYQALLVLFGWVWIQILALVSQEMVGPRFFIREGWAPPAYDYHPVLREDEEGATMPIGSTQTSEEESGSPSTTMPGESKEKGKKIFDCTICTQDIEVSVIPSGGSAESNSGLGGNILARRAYMVTPCRHIFHTPCLEGWMRYRLQCPNCREILPPL
ncbi:hypothetical protein K432DRAFT_292985 [Lepidopterella palustris CBS 459.81]|uniref:DSC E3 ubiquitin ligase complex subunit A n=1 Tax=Lepidopterella palustris CBS 459.81 TaxID=1314670 RepID=A0A8E2EEI6_9PEZI|nr:hypothetical protein K432DRAFT_292985 [Lepidopterella palustris CBS 459.81]